jgi:hypothetical protein
MDKLKDYLKNNVVNKFKSIKHNDEVQIDLTKELDIEYNNTNETIEVINKFLEAELQKDTKYETKLDLENRIIKINFLKAF